MLISIQLQLVWFCVQFVYFFLKVYGTFFWLLFSFSLFLKYFFQNFSSQTPESISILSLISFLTLFWLIFTFRDSDLWALEELNEDVLTCFVARPPRIHSHCHRTIGISSNFHSDCYDRKIKKCDHNPPKKGKVFIFSVFFLETRRKIRGQATRLWHVTCFFLIFCFINLQSWPKVLVVDFF